jgi:hypothetical protein
MNLEKKHLNNSSEKEKNFTSVDSIEKEVNFGKLAEEKVQKLETQKNSIVGFDWKKVIDDFKNSIKLSDEIMEKLINNLSPETHLSNIAQKAQSLFESARNRLIGFPEYPININEYAETEHKLQTRECKKIKDLAGGSFDTKYIKLKDDGAVVYKTYQQQKKYTADTEKGSIESFSLEITEESRRKKMMAEKAAYLVSKNLNFDMVPPTIIREINGIPGSCQEFIQNAKSGMEINANNLPAAEMLKLDLFDFLVKNLDRHPGNYLLKGGSIVAIDHGECFGINERNDIFNESVPREISQKRLPSKIIKSIADLFSDEKRLSELRDGLCDVLGKNVGNGYIERFRVFADSIDQEGKISVEKFQAEMLIRQAQY